MLKAFKCTRPINININVYMYIIYCEYIYIQTETHCERLKSIYINIRSEEFIKYAYSCIMKLKKKTNTFHSDYYFFQLAKLLRSAVVEYLAYDIVCWRKVYLFESVAILFVVVVLEKFVLMTK